LVLGVFLCGAIAVMAVIRQYARARQVRRRAVDAEVSGREHFVIGLRALVGVFGRDEGFGEAGSRGE
jgi:hypothetical protein